jgi:hypothetical protein
VSPLFDAALLSPESERATTTILMRPRMTIRNWLRDRQARRIWSQGRITSHRCKRKLVRRTGQT